MAACAYTHKCMCTCTHIHMHTHTDMLTLAGCTVLGVEITPDAAAVHTAPFSGPTAFMLGNEVRQETCAIACAGMLLGVKVLKSQCSTSYHLIWCEY